MSETRDVGEVVEEDEGELQFSKKSFFLLFGFHHSHTFLYIYTMN